MHEKYHILSKTRGVKNLFCLHPYTPVVALRLPNTSDQWCANPNLDSDSNLDSRLFELDSDSDRTNMNALVFNHSSLAWLGMGRFRLWIRIQTSWIQIQDKRGGFGFKPKGLDSDSDSRYPDSHITASDAGSSAQNTPSLVSNITNWYFLHHGEFCKFPFSYLLFDR